MSQFPFSQGRMIGDIQDALAIGSRRVVSMPVGEKHWLTSTSAVRAWEGWSSQNGLFASVPASGLLASRVLPQGCNVAVSFVIGHGSVPAGKTANVRLWLAHPIGAGVGGPHEAIEYVAQPFMDLLVTGGAMTLPAASQILPVGTPGVEAWADTVSVLSSYLVNATPRVWGNALGGRAEVGGEAGGGVQLLASAQVNGGGYTATGIGIFVRTL